MSTSSEKVKSVLSLYKIDLSKFDKNSSSETIIEKIASNQNVFKKDEKVSTDAYAGYKIEMYYAHASISYEKWKKFFGDLLVDGGNTFNSSNNDNPFHGGYLSFVSFFAKDGNVFALCMGKGYLLINRYIDDSFGFDVLTRIVKPEKSSLISASANYLSGATFENISFFRSAESFLSQDDFGKIYREAISQLDKDELALIGLTEKEIDKVNCIAKSSFTLKSGISLEKLLDDVIPKIISLFKDPAKEGYKVNRVTQISKNHYQYNDLKVSLYEKMRTNFTDFDFYSPTDTAGFFAADKYALLPASKGGEFTKLQDDLTNIENVEKIIKEKGILDFSDASSFHLNIEGSIYVQAYNENGQVLKEMFSLHRGLHGEFEHENKKYFWMNAKMWEVDEEFLKEFNTRVFGVLNDDFYKLVDEIPLKKFNWNSNANKGEHEDVYNKEHKWDDSFLCLDKKTPNGIELCDLLYSTKETTYLIHVKKGFDRSVRDLSSQVVSSARILHSTINTKEKQYLKEVYKFNKGIDIKGDITEKDFLALFKKKVVYVFAVASKTSFFDIKEFEKIKSNIAKLEAYELCKDFKKFSPPFELKVVQIPNL